MSDESTISPSVPPQRANPPSLFKRLLPVLVIGTAAGIGWAFSQVVGCTSGCIIQGSPPVMAAFTGLLAAQFVLTPKRSTSADSE